MTRLVGLADIQGNLAKWVCQQSPHRSVDGVDEANKMVREALDDKWEVLPDGYATRHFSDDREIFDWLWWVFSGSEVADAWNTPKNGWDHPNRDCMKNPDDDFIDLDALFRNVSQSVWADNAEYESAAA